MAWIRIEKNYTSCFNKWGWAFLREAPCRTHRSDRFPMGTTPELQSQPLQRLAGARSSEDRAQGRQHKARSIHMLSHYTNTSTKKVLGNKCCSNSFCSHRHVEEIMRVTVATKIALEDWSTWGMLLREYLKCSFPHYPKQEDSFLPSFQVFSKLSQWIEVTYTITFT